MTKSYFVDLGNANCKYFRMMVKSFMKCVPCKMMWQMNGEYVEFEVVFDSRYAVNVEHLFAPFV